MAALAVGGAAGFYSCMWLLPKLPVPMAGADADADGYLIFKTAIGVALGVAFTAALVALTMPWMRHRRRSGRGRRVAIAGVFVVLLSAGFAAEVHALIYNLLFAAWLAYATAFTYVRYGVLDSVRLRSGRTSEDKSADSAD
jgi:hypothetical protein